MVKITQKTLTLLIIFAIVMLLIPNQSLAFFGLFFKSNISLYSPMPITINDLFSINKTINIKNSGSYWSTISENYLMEITNPLALNKFLRKTKTIPPETHWVIATAYSSTKDQTDSTPFITASGTHVRDGVIATNFLPFGTIIKIPELYGNKTFIVEDRMNRRYSWGRIDIWFSERWVAKEFGAQRIKIEIVS